MDRRRQAWGLLGKGPVDLPQPTLDADRVGIPSKEFIDGIEFDYDLEPRCYVCAAEDSVRILVDQLLARGYTYKAILQVVQPLQKDGPAKGRISYHSVRRHQIRHLPVDELARRTALESQAKAEGLRIALGDTPIVTNAGVLEMIRDAGFERLVQGTLTPTTRETMQAALALEELDKTYEEQADPTEIRRQVQILIDLVKERLDKDVWESFTDDLKKRLGGGQPRGSSPRSISEAQEE